MTPPPETQVQSETLEEITDRLVDEHDCHCCVTAEALTASYAKLRADVLSALRNQRAACAKLLDVRVAEISNYQTRPYRVARRELEAAAKAIREGR